MAASPESEIESIECFQNYTAPEVFVQGLAGQINQQDVEAIIRAQKEMLQRFEKTNEMLINFNALSSHRFVQAQKDFKKHTALLYDMKKDLDNIFQRIRNLKSKVAQQYPNAFTAVEKESLKETDEDDEKIVVSLEAIPAEGSEEQHRDATKTVVSESLEKTKSSEMKKSCSSSSEGVDSTGNSKGSSSSSFDT